MADTTNPIQTIETWLDVPNRLVGKMDAMLANAQLPIPPFGRQVIMLAVLGGLVWLAQRCKGKPDEKALNTSLNVVSSLFGVVGGFVVWNWLQFFVMPLPADVKGVVHLVGAEDDKPQLLFDARVLLIDASGAQIIDGAGSPDTESGAFVMHCRHEIGRTPTAFRVEVPNCDTATVPVTRGQLRHQPMIDLAVKCATVH